MVEPLRVSHCCVHCPFRMRKEAEDIAAAACVHGDSNEASVLLKPDFAVPRLAASAGPYSARFVHDVDGLFGVERL